MKKVEEHIADAVAKGATVVAGGGRHALGGTFFQPTVVTEATPDGSKQVPARRAVSCKVTAPSEHPTESQGGTLRVVTVWVALGASFDASSLA